MALCAARLDQQEAAQRGDVVSRDFLSSPRMAHAENTRKPVFYTRSNYTKGGICPVKMGQFDSQYERRGERVEVEKSKKKKNNNKIRSILFKFVLVKIRYKAFFIFSFVTYDAWLGMVTFYNSANDFRNGSFFP